MDTVPLPTTLLEGQPVTIAAIIAMVLVVWILAPVVKLAFQFVLQILPAVQKLGDAAAALAEDVDHLQAEIQQIQQHNAERDRLIEQERLRQQGVNAAITQDLSHIKSELVAVNGKLDTLIVRAGTLNQAVN